MNNRTHWHQIWRHALLGALMTATTAAAQANPETAAAVATDLAARNNRVVQELQQLKQSNALSPQAVLALIQKEMSPIINFSRLAAQATGKYWRSATEDDKQRITQHFRILLEQNYAKLLARYDQQKVQTIESKTRADKTILVGVKVYGGNKSARIDYVFYPQDDNMQISDIQVEGISLLATYRRQFAQIAKQYGTAGLAAKLEELTKK